MAQSSEQSVAVPYWLVAVGSIAITFHLTAVVFGALMAPAPVNMFDGDMLPVPQFVQTVDNLTRPAYLNPTKLTHNYHFLTNAPSKPGIEFEVRLKDANGQPALVDAEGKEIILQFPDKNANPWVRQRESLLARNLGDDLPAMPPMSEEIAAPNQQAEMVQIWEPGKNRRLQLKLVPRHLVPRDQMAMQPTDWALLVARAYVRHLCRVHGAASGELTRVHQDPIPPAVLTMDSVQSGLFDKGLSDFGEVKVEGTAVDVRNRPAPRRR